MLLRLPIRYIGIPINKTISKQLPAEISLNIKDKGVNLLSYAIESPKPLLLNIGPYMNGKGHFILTPALLQAKLKHHLLPTTVVVEYTPNSIGVAYERMCQKTVAVAWVTQMEMAPQYQLSRPIQISPPNIKVFGSKKSLEKLKLVQTEFVVVKNRSDTTTLEARIKAIPGLHYQPNAVKIKICVEQFTEKKIQVPVQTLHCPNHLRIRTFPAFVNVTYRVGLSQFNNTDPNDIAVYFDYKQLNVGKQGKQKLKVNSKNAQISAIRIQPQEIEVLLEKK